jgi:hypothetical protein
MFGFIVRLAGLPNPALSLPLEQADAQNVKRLQLLMMAHLFGTVSLPITEPKAITSSNSLL